jgi:hypothetical protein
VLFHSFARQLQTKSSTILMETFQLKNGEAVFYSEHERWPRTLPDIRVGAIDYNDNPEIEHINLQNQPAGQWQYRHRSRSLI